MGQITKVVPSMIQVANNVTSTTVGNATSLVALTFDGSGVITSASNVALSVGVSSINATGTANSTTYLRGDGAWSQLNSTAISSGTSNVSVTTTNGNVIIGTAGTERVRVTTEGNVGIGTSLPVAYSGYGNLALNGTNGAFLQFHRGGTDEMEVYIDGTNNYIRGKTSKSMLFYTADTERMRIDSSGRVTMPYQPCFGCTGTFTPGTGVVAINVEQFDQGGNFNTSTYRFTAPIAGKYYIWGGVSFYAGSSGSYVRHGQLTLDRNGGTAIIKDFYYYNSSGSNVHYGPTVSGVLTLNANDYIELNMPTWSVSGSFSGYGAYMGGYLVA